MTGFAARLETPVRPGSSARAKPVMTEAQTEFVLRLLTFIALAGFALLHWYGVVIHPPAGRAFELLLVCAGGALAFALTASPRLPRPVARAARLLILVGLVALGLLATGLPAHYLKPRHWGGFGDHLNHGLRIVQATTYPYKGGDYWARLTLLLAGPAFLVPATALAFWPVKGSGRVPRALALVILIVFYGMALAERSPSGQVGRGFVLLLLIAAWLWLPRLKARDLGAASFAVLMVALVAMPVAAALDSSRGWLNYRDWRVLSDTAGVDYRWNHSYGPINWPRRGTTLLYVQANRPYYWKAETLNDFNGVDWIRTSVNTSVSAASELPPSPNHRWFQQVKVTVAGLRGNQVIGAGTPQSVSSSAGDTELSGDGTVTAIDHSLHDGENYTVSTYVPQPTRAQLQASGQSPYEGYFGVYTKLVLPLKLRAGSQTTEPVRLDPGLWGTNPGDPATTQIARQSPYAAMYRLARRLAAGATSPYEVVRRVERYLGSNRFSYDERPPVRKYPLEAFLFRDHRGYCQQFSGAMALLLRMDGIPARIATGFAPGEPQTDSPGVYRVRDFDAHSWVEVYFSGIGWVTFDPTPALSPASSQIADASAASVGDARKAPALPGPKGLGDTGRTVTGTAVRSHSSTLSWWMLPAALAVIVVLGMAGWRLRRAVLRHRHLTPDERAVEELRSALETMGARTDRGLTLTGAERMLERRAGPDAARFATRLREYRYGLPGARLPGPHERRALRRALARGARPFGALKALKALPPLHF
ncbi:MAG TPA: transglutaminaseTgpA domain-containing protein [Thermoleophilaceae bacterium]